MWGPNYFTITVCFGIFASAEGRKNYLGLEIILDTESILDFGKFYRLLSFYCTTIKKFSNLDSNCLPFFLAGGS